MKKLVFAAAKIDDKTLKKIEPKLESLGIKIRKKLECGSKGCAFLTDKGQVLKITADKKEAETSAKLVGKKMKSTAKYFKVFTLSSVKKYYFILQEYLKPASSDVLLVLKEVNPMVTTEDIPELLENAAELNSEIKDKASCEEFFKSRIEYQGKDVYKNVANLYYSIKKNLKKYPLVQGQFLRSAEQSDSFLKDSGEFFKNPKYVKIMNDIYSSLKELKDNGIIFIDSHVGNIRTDGKNLKWIDLGIASKAPGSGKIEVIKARGKNVMKKELKVLYRKDKKLALEVAKVLGYKITASTTIEQVKDVLENGAKKIQGKMVDAFTASLVMQIYNAAPDAIKKKMENEKIGKLVTICWKLKKKLGAKTVTDKVIKADDVINKRNKTLKEFKTIPSVIDKFMRKINDMEKRTKKGSLDNVLHIVSYLISRSENAIEELMRQIKTELDF